MFFVFVCIFVLLLVGVLSGGQWIATFDAGIRSVIAIEHAPGLSPFALSFSGLLSPSSFYSILILLSLVLLFRRQWRAAFIWIVTLVGAGGSMELIKWLVMRPRPNDGIIFLSDPSFPSGHATMSVAFFGLVMLYIAPEIPRGIVRGFLIFACTFLVFFVGLSRIYLGVHYPSDVLAGWVLGILWIYVASHLRGDTKVLH